MYSVSLVPLLALFFAAEANAMEISAKNPSFLKKNKTTGEVPREVSKKVAVKAAKTGGVMSSLKLKILIAVLSIILLGGGIAAVVVVINQLGIEEESQGEIVFNEENESEEDYEDVFSTEDSDVTSEITSQITSETEYVGKYESTNLKLIYEPLAETITDMVGIGDVVPLLLADNIIYKLNYSSFMDEEEYTEKGFDYYEEEILWMNEWNEGMYGDIFLQ